MKQLATTAMMSTAPSAPAIERTREDRAAAVLKTRLRP
jgi:hypothetical protein